MPVPLFAYKARAVSVRAFACSGYAADNLVDAVHLRASWWSRAAGPGDGHL